ncbi:MAG: hypothetical protein KIH62_001470 [Candidatus Kerfeldbacteria bacterium]|nr:hypothetical protein [Candidatus Kerfeldbacteria bacterium]
MANEEQQKMTFGELFGVPENPDQLKAIDLQGVQQHIQHLLAYIEETRAMHNNETRIVELTTALKSAQKVFREAEVDHLAATQEIADPDSGEIHDVLEKESNEALFTKLLTTYMTSLQGLKSYVDDTIVKLHAAGKLNVE